MGHGLVKDRTKRARAETVLTPGNDTGIRGANDPNDSAAAVDYVTNRIVY